MKNKFVESTMAAVLFGGGLCLAGIRGMAVAGSSSFTPVVPTPTWTAAQLKAYHQRVEAYRRYGYKSPPRERTYICAFCGYKSRHDGLCPKCGFEMTLYDPKAKTLKKVYSSGSR